MPVGINFQRAPRWLRRGIFGGAGLGTVHSPVHIVPQATAPTNVAKGNLWFSSTLNRLMASDGTSYAGAGGSFTVEVQARTAAQAVDGWDWVAPVACKVKSVKAVWSTVSTSGVWLPRKVTDASAPGAAASATVKNLITAGLNTSEAINVAQTGTLSATPADFTFAAGDKLGSDWSGTVTGLVGFVGVIEFEAV